MEKYKVKTLVFGVSFWGHEEPKRINPWYKCVNKNIKYDDIFLSCGSYSNPQKLKLPIEMVQIGIKNTKPYDKNWSYYYVGFMTGIYHALIHKDFDILIHVQNRTFIGMDLNPVIEEFIKRPEIIAAPKYTSQIGTFIETGLMIMKKQAVQQYATSNLRVALSDREQLNVEQEALNMFLGKWWNFIPDIPTIRKKDTTYDYNKSPFDMPDELFYDLPIIAGPEHCTEEEFNKWMEIKNEDIIDR